MTTAHGVVETPAFMPVGTKGAVKAITHRDLESLGAEILLGNTYHLYLRPGDDLIARQVIQPEKVFPDPFELLPGRVLHAV